MRTGNGELAQEVEVPELGSEKENVGLSGK